MQATLDGVHVDILGLQESIVSPPIVFFFRSHKQSVASLLEAITEDGHEGKAFNIFCFMEPEYAMKIMDTWMTLEELDGTDTRQEYKGRDGESLARLFKYRQPFCLHFRYRHQVDNHNNRRHAPISIERTWETKFWPDRNFAWYLAVTEVNTALADGHFRKGGKWIPTLQFRRKLAREIMENNIGGDTVDSGSPRRSTCTPSIFACTLLKVKNNE